MGAIADLKLVVVTALLEREDFIFVVVDPSHPNIRLPDFLIEAAQPVGLNIGYRMPVPIPDLEVGDDGIEGTLSFSRQPFPCAIPWEAVLQVSVGEEHLVWVVPPRESTAEGPEEPTPDTERPKLRLV